jgi:hypothetical protein
VKVIVLILLTVLAAASPASAGDATNNATGSKPRRQLFSFRRVALSTEQRKQLDLAVASMTFEKKTDAKCDNIEAAAALLWRSISIAASVPAAADYRGFIVFSRLDWAKMDDQSFKSGFAVRKGTGEMYRWEEHRTQRTASGAAGLRPPVFLALRPGAPEL